MGNQCVSTQKEVHRADKMYTQVQSQAPILVVNKNPQVAPSASLLQPAPSISHYSAFPYPSITQNYNGVAQQPMPSLLPPFVGSFPQQPQPQRNQVEQVDIVKAKLKSTRDRVNNLIAQQESDLAQIDRQINQEKANGLRNKPKVKFLLRQRKDYIRSLDDLRTRQQVVMKTVSDLSQQHLDKSIVEVLDQSNQYMQQVQEELERKNWKEVLYKAASQQDIFQSLGLPEDNEVDQLYAELERQVEIEKSQQSNSPQKAGSIQQQPQLQFQQPQPPPQAFLQQQQFPQQMQQQQYQQHQIQQQQRQQQQFPPQTYAKNFQQPPLVPGVPFVESFDRPISDSMNQFEMNPPGEQHRASNIPPQLSQMQQPLIVQTNALIGTQARQPQLPINSLPIPPPPQQQMIPTVIVPPVLQPSSTFANQTIQQQPMLN